MRTLIAVRTHKADAMSLAAYDRYATVPGTDIAFACDERTAPVLAGDRRKAAFDAERLERMGLYPHPQCGWRCGDYNFYVLREDFPDYDDYWLIEPDVLINTPDISAFFAPFADDRSDFLAARFGTRAPHWDWYPKIKDTFPDVHGCIFPMTRISGPAIDHLYAQRRALSARFTGRPPLWPNDESFTASALVAGGFVCADLNAPGRMVRTDASMRTGVAHDPLTLAEHPPDGLIYHPVRDISAVAADAERKLHKLALAGSRGVEIRRQLSWLRRLADTLLQSPGYHGAALAPLALALVPLEPDLARKPARATGIGEDKALAIGRRRLQKNFGPTGRVAALATVHGLAGPADDLAEAPGEAVAVFPHGFALPLSVDAPSRQLVFSLHIAPHVLLAEPDLAAAQRSLSRVIARVPFDALPRLNAAPGGGAPVVILAQAGAGDLLQTLLRAAAPRFIHATVVLAGLLAGSSQDAAAVLAAAIGAYTRLHMPDDAGGPCVLWLDDASPALADSLRLACPQARFATVAKRGGGFTLRLASPADAAPAVAPGTEEADTLAAVIRAVAGVLGEHPAGQPGLRALLAPLVRTQFRQGARVSMLDSSGAAMDFAFKDPAPQAAA